MKFATMFEQAAKHPKAMFTARSYRCDEMVQLSYAELLAQVEALAVSLEGIGCVAGNVIGISLANSVEFVVWDLAAIKLGLVLQVFTEGQAPNEEELQSLAKVLTLWVHQGMSLNIEVPEFNVTQSESLATVKLASDRYYNTEPLLHSKVYSSGTSGYLKGLKISNKGTERLISGFLTDFALTDADHHLIFLPLSNYQQRMSVYACLACGCSITVVDFTQVFSQLAVVKPTFIIAPPAVYENIYNTFSAMEEAGAKVRQFLGGKMRFMLTGMAGIKPKILQAFSDWGLVLLEAYGVTETGMIAWNTQDNNKPGTVGRAIYPDEVIICDDGEVLINRQYPLSLGYFQASQSDSRATFLTNGDIATGDIATIDNQGYISLSGRKKTIITTAAGVKFHPEIVEKQLEQLQGVLNSVVFWASHPGLLKALIVVADKSDQAVVESIQAQIYSYNETTQPWMKVGKVIFTDVAFSVEAGTLTRNMKLNRNGIEAIYLSHEGVS